MTKAPTPTEMSKGQSDNTNNATKKFDYTATADQLRTVSWSNYSHPTGVVNRFDIVMSIIFGPLKTLPRSSKSCDCVTFGVLRYLLSTFLLYTPHCHMILSKQKCCLLSTGVSTESEKRTSVLQIRQGFLATRNMTHINVGLARSYVKLLLSSWKTYMCNLKT